jgi:hydroxypyruvate isomerase
MNGRKLAVNAEMTFLELPFYERISRLHELGFRVGLWSLDGYDVERLGKIGATYSMIDGFGRGNLALPDAADAMVSSIAEQIPLAKAIGRPLLNLHGGKLTKDGPAAEPIWDVTGEMWMNARHTLCRIAELGEKHDVYFSIENLNPLDHPGVPFHSALDVLALVKSVGSPRIGINLDLFHAQKDGGNLIDLLGKCLDFAAEVQVADVPMRDVPGRGEIHYPNVADAMVKLGYDCSVGLEAFAPGNCEAELTRFRTIFSAFHG